MSVANDSPEQSPSNSGLPAIAPDIVEQELGELARVCEPPPYSLYFEKNAG